jgi:hypothetical protein
LIIGKSSVYIAPNAAEDQTSPILVSAVCPQGSGQVAEWFKAHAWNACVRESVPRVRIPLCPPLFIDLVEKLRDIFELAYFLFMDISWLM